MSSARPTTVARRGRMGPGAAATLGLLALATVAALKLGAPLLVPIVVSLLLSQFLAPLVRTLTRARVSESVAAAIVVFGFTSVVGTGVVLLASPAAAWVGRAPETFAQVERKVRKLTRPLQSLERAAQKVEDAAAGSTARPTVQVDKPGFLQRLSGITVSMIGGILSVVFLTYFLLANGPLFRQKLAEILPHRSERKRVEETLMEIEVQMSRYLVLNTAICVVVGTVTGVWVQLMGLPNSVLWGVVTGVLNFVPYLGAVVTMGILALASLVSFDTLQPPLLIVGGFAVVNLLEGNLITPMVMGRKLPINAVALFIGFMFWGWVWGVIGAVLAVPLTVLIKIVCDRIEGAKPFAVFLDN